MEQIELATHLKGAQSKLLQEGARSYLDAANAIFEYQREIVRASREVFEKRLDDYSDALRLGTKLSSDEVAAAFLTIDPEKWQTSYAKLGVNINRNKARMAGDFWWGTGCYAWWEYWDSATWFATCVVMWLPHKLAFPLFQRMHVHEKTELEYVKHEIWLSRELKADQADAFEDQLGDVMDKWISLCRKVGGLKGIGSLLESE